MSQIAHQFPLVAGLCYFIWFSINQWLIGGLGGFGIRIGVPLIPFIFGDFRNPKHRDPNHQPKPLAEQKTQKTAALDVLPPQDAG